MSHLDTQDMIVYLLRIQIFTVNIYLFHFVRDNIDECQCSSPVYPPEPIVTPGVN